MVCATPSSLSTWQTASLWRSHFSVPGGTRVCTGRRDDAAVSGGKSEAIRGTSGTSPRWMGMSRFGVQSVRRLSVGMMMAIVVFGAGAAAAAGSPRWTRPVVIARGTCRVAPSSLAVAQNDRGNALVAWVEICGSDWRVVTSSRSPGRRFNAPGILSVTRAPLVTPHVEIALDAHGGATVVWTRERFGILSPGSTVVVSTRKPGRRFGQPHSSTVTASDPRWQAMRAAKRS